MGFLRLILSIIRGLAGLLRETLSTKEIGFMGILLGNRCPLAESEKIT